MCCVVCTPSVILDDAFTAIRHTVLQQRRATLLRRVSNQDLGSAHGVDCASQPMCWTSPDVVFGLGFSILEKNKGLCCFLMANYHEALVAIQMSMWLIVCPATSAEHVLFSIRLPPGLVLSRLVTTGMYFCDCFCPSRVPLAVHLRPASPHRRIAPVPPHPLPSCPQY